MSKRCGMFLLLAAAVLLTLRPAAAQGKGFINIKGVKGESTDKSHDGWIDLLSIDLGLNSGLLGGRAGSRSSWRGHNAIQVVKKIDKASPLLLKSASRGEKLGTVVLEFVTRDSQGTPSYLKLTMTDVVISSVTPSGSGGDDRPTETVSLSFKTVKWEYEPADKTDRAA